MSLTKIENLSKTKLRPFQKQNGNLLSTLRKNELIACQTLKNQNPIEEILKDIEEKEKEIKKN